MLPPSPIRLFIKESDSPPCPRPSFLFSEASDQSDIGGNDFSPIGRSHVVFHAPHKHNVLYKNKEKETSRKPVVQRDAVLLQRDRAVLALHTYLNMDLDDSQEVVDAFPDLYLKCPNLGSRILYLQHELSLVIPKMVELLKAHPSMVISTLLKNPEQHNIVSTVEVLQTELNVSFEDIVSHRLNNLYRTDVIRLFREIIPGRNNQELNEIILKDPKLLKASSSSASAPTTFQSEGESASYSNILAVLRNELHLTNVQLERLIRTSPDLLLMDHKQLQEASSEWEFILNGPIGDGLGRVKRRGIDTTLIDDPEEKQMIILYRAQELILRCPELLSSTHLRNTVAFFVGELHVSPFNLGRIAYRRPKLLMFDQSIIGEKVVFFRKCLEFPEGQEGTEAIIDMLWLCPDILTQSIKNNLAAKIDYFRNEIGMNTTELRSMLSARPQIMAYALDGNIRTKIDLLVKVSKIPMEVVRTMIAQYPQVLRKNLTIGLIPRCHYLLEKYPDGIPCPSEEVPVTFLNWSDDYWQKWMRTPFETEEDGEQEETTEVDTASTDDDNSAKALDLKRDKVQVKAPKAKKVAKSSRKKVKGAVTSEVTTLEPKEEEQDETTEVETIPTDEDTSTKGLDMKGDKVQLNVPKAKKAAKGSRKKAKGAVTSTGPTFETEEEEEQDETTDLDTATTYEGTSAKVLDMKGDKVQVKAPKAKKVAKGSRAKVKGAVTSTSPTFESEEAEEEEQDEATKVVDTAPTDSDASAKAKKAVKGSRKKVKVAATRPGPTFATEEEEEQDRTTKVDTAPTNEDTSAKAQKAAEGSRKKAKDAVTSAGPTFETEAEEEQDETTDVDTTPTDEDVSTKAWDLKGDKVQLKITKAKKVAKDSRKKVKGAVKSKVATFEPDKEKEEEQDEATELDTATTEDDTSAKVLDMTGDKVQVKAPKGKKVARGSRKRVEGAVTSTGPTFEIETEEEQDKTTKVDTTPTDLDTSAKAKKAAKGSRKKVEGAVTSTGSTFETETEEEQDKTTKVDTTPTDLDASAKAQKVAKRSRKKAKGAVTSTGPTFETEEEGEQDETTKVDTTPTNEDTSVKALDTKGDKVQVKAPKAKKAVTGSRKNVKSVAKSQRLRQRKRRSKTKPPKYTLHPQTRILLPNPWI